MASRAPERAYPTSPGARAVAAVVIVAFSLPLVFLATEILANSSEAIAVAFSSETAAPLARSLALATAAALSAGLLGGGLAWILVRHRVPGRVAWMVLVPLPLVIPSFVGATALRFAFGPGGLVPFVPRLDGFLGAWLVLVLFTYPYVYLLVSARLWVLPAAWEDAARVLGSDARRVRRTVLWPQVRGSLTAGMLLVFLYALSDFGAVSIMRFDTLTRAIFSARLASPITALTLGFVLALAALAVAAGEWRSRRTAGIAGADRASRPLIASRPWMLVPPAVSVGLGLLAPVAAFLVWWLRGTAVSGGGVGEVAGSVTELLRPAFNSAAVGIAAALVAVVVLLPVALAAADRRSRVGKLGGAIASANFALPGIVVAFAIVFWIVRAPDPLFAAYQTFPLLIFAYVVHFAAQALGPMSTSAVTLPKALTEAAGTLGAGRMRRLRTVMLPMMLPGLAAAAGLVLLSVLKELPATLLLAPPGFQTLATKIWGAAEEGFLGTAGVASLVLIGLSGVLTWILVLRTADVR